MSLSMYRASIPVFIHAFGNLSAILDKGAEHAKSAKLDPSTLIEARLFENMYTLPGQIQRASDTAKGFAARVAQIENPKYEDNEKTFADLEAAKARLKDSGRIATLGFCWGGTISFRAAGHVEGIAGAVCYYGTQIAPYTAEQPRCPVLMHFGDKDHIATLEHAGALRAAQGALVEIQVYPAGHSFSCDETPNYHAASADLALRRSLEFLATHVG